MTRACIVGWAHTPFGKLEEPDVEGLIARVSGEALAHAGRRGIPGRRHLCRLDEHRLLEAGFRGVAGGGEPAGPRPRAGDPPGERLRHRLGGALRGPRLRRQRPGPDRPGDRRREDDGQDRRRDRRHPARRLLPEGGGRDRGRLRGRVRADRGGLLPALRRPQRGAGPDRRQEPPQRRRQPLCAATQGSRLRLLQPGLREEPLRGGAPAADRLLADLGRRGGSGGGRCRDRRGAGAGDRLPRPGACQRHPAPVPPRPDGVQGRTDGLGEGARARPGSATTTSPSWRPTTASPSPS